MSAREEARAEVNRRHPAWHDNGVGIVQGSHYRSGFEEGAAWQAARPITDAQVDAALAAWWGCAAEGPGAQGSAMRAALEAARRL